MNFIRSSLHFWAHVNEGTLRRSLPWHARSYPYAAYEPSDNSLAHRDQGGLQCARPRLRSFVAISWLDRLNTRAQIESVTNHLHLLWSSVINCATNRASGSTNTIALHPRFGFDKSGSTGSESSIRSSCTG